MKKFALPYIILSMLLFNGLRGICQQYFPISDSSNVWFEYFQAEPNYEYYYQQWQVKNDTVIDGIQYKFLKHLFQSITPSYDPGYHLIFGDVEEITEPLYFIRDDTAAQKVYLLTSYAGFNEETLLFNFGLGVGDTLDFGLDGPHKIVYAIDFVNIGGDMHKRLKIISEMDLINPYADIIEGVGSTLGLLYNMDPPFEERTEIECFTHLGISTYNFYEGSTPQPVDSASVCEFMEPTGLNDINWGSDFQINPCPAHNFIIIDLTDIPPGNWEMQIINSNGEICKNESACSGARSDLNISDLPTGLYVIKLFNDRTLLNSRFIRQ